MPNVLTEKKPKNPHDKIRFLHVRYSHGHIKTIVQMANKYTGGNLSKWIRIASLNYKPKR